jgi:hypothetical protein
LLLCLDAVGYIFCSRSTTCAAGEAVVIHAAAPRHVVGVFLGKFASLHNFRKPMLA